MTCFMTIAGPCVSKVSNVYEVCNIVLEYDAVSLVF